MANICLTFGTKISANLIRDALASLEGLQRWWTQGTTGNPEKGGTIHFRFGENGGFDMKVITLSDNQVRWECTEGPQEWVGTHIEFTILPGDNANKLMFRHVGWQEENPFFHHCSMKWATFLLSLKDYLESGSGRPFPNDLKIEAVGM